MRDVTVLHIPERGYYIHDLQPYINACARTVLGGGWTKRTFQPVESPVGRKPVVLFAAGEVLYADALQLCDQEPALFGELVGYAVQYMQTQRLVGGGKGAHEGGERRAPLLVLDNLDAFPSAPQMHAILQQIHGLLWSFGAARRGVSLGATRDVRCALVVQQSLLRRHMHFPHAFVAAPDVRVPPCDFREKEQAAQREASEAMYSYIYHNVIRSRDDGMDADAARALLSLPDGEKRPCIADLRAAIRRLGATLWGDGDRIVLLQQTVLGHVTDVRRQFDVLCALHRIRREVVDPGREQQFGAFAPAPVTEVAMERYIHAIVDYFVRLVTDTL